MLNHSPRTVTGRHYNHAKYFEPMRLALEAWSARVRDIIAAGEPTSTIAMSGSPRC